MQKLYKIGVLMLAILIVTSSLTSCGSSNKSEFRTVVDITGAEVEIPVEVDEVIYKEG